MFFYIFVYIFIHLHIYLIIILSCNYSDIHPAFHVFIQIFILSCIHLDIYPFIYSFRYLSFHVFIQTFILTYIYLDICPFNFVTRPSLSMTCSVQPLGNCIPVPFNFCAFEIGLPWHKTSLWFRVSGIFRPNQVSCR